MKIDYNLAYDCCAHVIEKNKLSYPLDVFSLIHDYEIKTITYTDLSCNYDISVQEIIDGCSEFGFLERDIKSNRAIIYYNDMQSDGIINFALLHELGHYLMNHTEESKENENLANCFARNLIAPANMCLQLNFDNPYTIQKYFNISFSCAKTRLDFLYGDLVHINKLGKHPKFCYRPITTILV